MVVLLRVPLFLLVLLSAWVAAPFSNGFAQDEPADQNPAGRSIVVESDGTTDAAIEQRLGEIFRQLSDFNQVQVESAAGVVTLTGQVVDVGTAESAEQLAVRVQGVVTVRNELTLEASVEKRLRPAFERLGERLRSAYDLAPLIGIAIVVFAVISLFGIWIASLRSPWDRIAPNVFVADLLRQVLRLAFFAAGLVVALDILDATALLGTILGAAGIVGLAVGFALRDTIENYVASIMLSVRQPFRPNDHIKIGGFEGHVIRLTSRATILMSFDGNHIRIPNTEIFKGIIENFTRNPERRFDFTVGIDADHDPAEAIDIGLDTLRHLDFVLDDPGPVAIVRDIGDSNIVLWFAGWVDQRNTDFGKARGESIRLTKTELENAGIALPEPIYRLRIDHAGPSAADTLDKPPPSTSASRPTSAPPLDPPRDTTAGDASRETAVPQKVAAERIAKDGSDLLDPSAPQE